MKLEIKNLHKSFVDADKRLVVIDGLSFAFPEQASVAIVGRSGVGKSTLLHLLAGLDQADSGQILLNGTDIEAKKSEELSVFRGQNIGFIFQFHHLLSDFTALENVAMPLIIQGTSDSEALARAEEALKLVGLSKRISHTPGELSGGEQQRVAIARALVSKPQIVLADEPTGNLDIHTANEIGQLLREVQRQERTLMVIVTHSNDLAQTMDYVFEMLPGGNLVQVKKGRSLAL